MAPKDWKELSLTQQLGNIGSEISRANYWEGRGDLAARNNALERALAMTDLAIDDQRHFGHLKEVCRLREVIADLLIQAEVFQVTLGDLLNYLMPFAFLARK
ncbi:MAG: hypothetical protein A2729_02725 [Candidatus Buchananbacteria bacterium RIFCSPHIGHO2_01_FULL_39_14]|uniref:Uncharacterized protein n=2 Tax=Candidatus Buchananiibacteriota TaxID=1817903 RepID=A0A1G1YTE5_9BACT|nr:MAG: hypothetical protein A2729_02725 [Candidatus Buchananbacteria bacterium RIFCSPHIGHO2_01_FULL_39_14]OGY49459.1 MAG: hypothetical protein A3D39_02890 [Candidatus Buchananbacteria bacterium RIFCSPHIGHO2_02_FULL_39_17]OGY55618.1 MAG: hypothetical protein A2912_05415 [Candidatus Buchananbacteria bacterium RIFCSPLOWO2_01_FULL_40_23b]